MTGGAAACPPLLCTRGNDLSAWIPGTRVRLSRPGGEAAICGGTCSAFCVQRRAKCSSAASPRSRRTLLRIPMPCDGHSEASWVWCCQSILPSKRPVCGVPMNGDICGISYCGYIGTPSTRRAL